MIYAIIDAALLWAASYECFRILQSTGYRPQRGYFKILLSPYFGAAILAQIAALLFYFYRLPHYSISIALAAFAVTFLAIRRKSPLKFTKRILRMAAVQLAECFLLCYFVNGAFFALATSFLTLISFAVCLPIDKLAGAYYVNKAVNKLSKSDVTVIAVTGSYGKTSVKDMLCALLDDSVTPKGSCNTPLGIARFINSTDLYYVKYLILEFGARNVGDVAELCALFKPKYGIVTGVCPQHMSTFKTFDNVLKTKAELVKCLPSNGACLLNCKDENAMSYVLEGTCKKIASDEGITVSARSIDIDGTHLRVNYQSMSKEAVLPQVSDYIADTFVLCLKMCLILKQSFGKTMSRVVNIKQTPHRMELIKTPNGYIIDDSYNGSIAGVKSCAKTLSNFNLCKTVITQGIVECGKDKRQINEECGEILGNACDVAIVLGRNKKYLCSGLSKTNCKVIRAKNLKDAVKISKRYCSGGILLFQNDLPDVANL